MRNATLRFLALVVGVFLVVGGAPVQAQGTFAHGAVVALQGTPHLWIADDRGILHWGGDTRALSGKHVNWNDRRDVSLAELQTYPIGDPWLSAGLLKDGDPIYQVKWETDWPQPQLLHIQSIKDVELFGINGSNYGNFVIEKNEWERRFGISAAGLQRGVLAAAVAPGDWEQWDKVDPLTNARTIGIGLRSFDYNYVGAGSASAEWAGLYVRCRYGLPEGSTLEVAIVWNTELDSSRPQVLTRADEQAVQSNQWISIAREQTFAPEPAVRDRLIEHLKRASRFVARVVKQDQSTITGQWDIAGFAVAVKPVEARCGR